MRHIPEYAGHPQARLAGFYDLNQERARELAEKWGGKAYSVGFVHGFPQVGDESAQIGIIGSYILRFIPEHGRSVNVDW